MSIKTNPFSLEYLPFDSEVFGITCGRMIISEPEVGRMELREFFFQTKQENYVHLVAKVPAEWISINRGLQDLGFKFIVTSLNLEKIPEKIRGYSSDINQISINV